MPLQAKLLQRLPLPSLQTQLWKERKLILNFFQNSLPLFREIGEEVKSIYTSDYKVTWKKKDDPLTEADLFVHTAIKNFLKTEYPDIPLLSEEEDSIIDFSKVPEFFSLDPIDGTREFVNKNPEFAVSLGFVKNGCPILGIVYNPITDEFIYGKTGDGIGRIYLNDTVSKLPFRRNSSERKYSPDQILVSRSEDREGLYSDDFWLGKGKIVPKGSIAYKLALTALSESDICISLKPKNIWDICAGTAIINATGGLSVELKSFYEINYFNPAVTAPGILAGNPFIVMDYIRMYKKELSERRKEGW